MMVITCYNGAKQPTRCSPWLQLGRKDVVQGLRDTGHLARISQVQLGGNHGGTTVEIEGWQSHIGWNHFWLVVTGTFFIFHFIYGNVPSH